MVHRILIGLKVVLIASAVLFTFVSSHSNADEIAEPERLIEKFRLTVFRDGLDPDNAPPLKITFKWGAPVRLYLIDDADRYRDYTKTVARQLMRLTGLSVRVAHENSLMPINFVIFLMPKDEVLDFLLQRKTPPDLALKFAEADCMGKGKDDSGRLSGGFLIITKELDEESIRHCLLAEITQAFGLYANSEIFQPSIFSDWVENIEKLPINDKILIRTLYDKRIKPGMPREEAMKIAREIIPDLVAKVRALGEEALYQR